MRRKPNLPFEDSGFKVEVSDASESDFPQQCKDAETFLRRHYDELSLIKGAEESELDFGYDCRIGTGEGGKQIVLQCDYIPVGLVKVCGELSIGIALTLFPPRDDHQPSEQDGGGNAQEPLSHPSTAPTKSRATP